MSELRQTSRFGNGLKALAGIVLLLCALVVSHAASLTNKASFTLGWDRSPSDYLTNYVTYKVYGGTNFVGTNLTVITNFSAGTNLSVTITNIAPGKWTFYATASQLGMESLPSPTLSVTVPSNAPSPPGTFVMVYLENENILTVTNWSDLGLFRARIYIPPP